MLCICHKDNKIWLLHYDSISHLKAKFNIGQNKSKYNKYLVTEKNIVNKLNDFFIKTKKFIMSDCMIPTSVYQQQEHTYRSLRENKINKFYKIYLS